MIVWFIKLFPNIPQTKPHGFQRTNSVFISVYNCKLWDCSKNPPKSLIIQTLTNFFEIFESQEKSKFINADEYWVYKV